MRAQCPLWRSAMPAVAGEVGRVWGGKIALHANAPALEWTRPVTALLDGCVVPARVRGAIPAIVAAWPLSPVRRDASPTIAG
ncbi:hypothetical protein TP38_05430 [Xanthomonas citri pv. citri]|nr:hypothetical protein TP38_05430 [Xanthomonas citri pv. citri]CEE20487.1 conserved hypothetical protein [Xanthomonas citri pv. citri]